MASAATIATGMGTPIFISEVPVRALRVKIAPTEKSSPPPMISSAAPQAITK